MKKSFVLYMDQYAPIEKLSLTQKGCLLDAIFSYQKGETVDCIDEVVDMAFQFFKQTFDRDNDKYLKKCEKNAENARKRWDAKDTGGCERIQTDANHADSGNGNGNGSDKIVGVKEDSDKSEQNNFDFEKFWILYNKKDGKKKCSTKWARLRESDRIKIFKVLPEYIKSTPDPKYRKNPLTYLNGEHWNDEIVSSNLGLTKTERDNANFKNPEYYGADTPKTEDSVF